MLTSFQIVTPFEFSKVCANLPLFTQTGWAPLKRAPTKQNTMIKGILPIISLAILISCNSETDTEDYFGQPEPKTTPVIFGKDIISVKGRFEHGISFTPDTRELTFGILNKDDFSGDIYYSKKVKDEWTKPETFEPLENESVYLPYFSPNGNSLVFTQSKSDTAYHNKEIWVIKKNNRTWSNPEIMKVPLSPISSVSNACMTLDGTVYFSSNINCIGIENCNTADLFCSKLISSQYQSVEEIPELCSQYDEESIFISPKEEYLIFCRFTDYSTWMDLYISYRDINENWLEPQIIDSTINSNDWDRRPFVSIDNKYLFFTRLQIGEKGLTESDLYWVNTQKVFKPYAFNPISDTTIKVGNETKLTIPIDYFKDIDNEILKISLNHEKFDWVRFDEESMTLTMTPSQVGEFELIFKAADSSSNECEDKFKIIVD